MIGAEGRVETDEELLSIPNPSAEGRLVGEVLPLEEAPDDDRD